MTARKSAGRRCSALLAELACYYPFRNSPFPTRGSLYTQSGSYGWADKHMLPATSKATAEQMRNMRQPIMPMVLAFAFGILVAEQLPLKTTWVLAAAGALCLCYLACLVFSRRRLAHLAAVLFLMVLGSARHSLSVTLPQNHVRALASEERRLVCVRGVVCSSPEIFAQGLFPTSPSMWSRFTLSSDSIRKGPDWVPTSGRCQVSVSGQLLELNYGDRLELVGQLSLPVSKRNPGESNYRKLLSRRGIFVLLKPGGEGNIAVIGHNHGSRLLAFVYGQKRNLKRLINLHFRPHHSRMLRCLLLGERYAIPRKQRELFLRTGTVHLLAISGLHVGIIAGFIWLCARALAVRTSLAAWLVMTVVISYAFIVGPRPSVLRATLMTVILCLGIIIRRRADFLNTLALTALVILLLAPRELFQAGFQLSFVAVLGIILFARGTSKWLASIRPLAQPAKVARRWYPVRSRLNLWAGRGMAVALLAWLSTAPLSAYYFNIFTPFNVLLNILLVPIIWLVLVLGILFLLTAGLWAGIAFIITAPLKLLLDIFHVVVQAAARIPGVGIYLATPSLLVVILAYLVFLGFALRIWLKVSRRRLAMAALLLVNWFVFNSAVSSSSREARLTCLDVGQGLSLLLELPGRFNLLYDAGSMRGGAVGERVISRFLWSKGIERIDLLVLSHSHWDHMNAVPALLARFNVGQVAIASGFRETRLGKDLLNLFREHKIPVSLLSQNDRVKLGRAWLNVLSPPPPQQQFPKLDFNNASLVVKLETNGKRFLLCGDIDEPGIAYLLRQRLRTDVVVVPHHGSHNNNNLEFVEAALPEIALVSSNAWFRNRHTLETYCGANARLFQTSKSGAITIATSPSGLQASSFVKTGMELQ